MSDAIPPERLAGLLAERRRLKIALRRAHRLCCEALPKFNWGASALDANAIELLNTVPGEIAALIEATAERG